jgi:predicted alpha/beta superfamily hydrolase
MNVLSRLFLALLLPGAVAALHAADAPVAPAPAPAPAAVSIANSQLRPLPRAANGRDYQLYVGLPAAYASHPEKRYPVLYLTDGYWDFPLLSAIYGNLYYDQVLPEIIIVGIGYRGENPNYDVLRSYDLTPVTDASKNKDEAHAGHAAEFLSVIQKEIIPFVEREYRVDPSYRALEGHSQGGLFALYAMFTKPDLFQAYVALSPAVDWGNEWIFRCAEQYGKSGRPLPTRLFLTGAADEWPFLIGSILRFNTQIRGHAYPGLTYEWRLLEGERHSGGKAEGHNRGLRFAFAPRAPK